MKGRRRNYFISKAQTKAKKDLLEGKQQSIEWVLRAVRSHKKGQAMKILSFNCRGLAGPHKISSLRRVVFLEHPYIIILQEILALVR